MKKKWIAVTALTVCAASTFTACGKFDPGLHYEIPKEHVYTEVTKLSEYNNYTVAEKNEAFVYFTKTETGTTKTVHVVYSLNEKKEAYRYFNEAILFDYYVALGSDHFAVTKVEWDEGKTAVKSNEVAVYNAIGANVLREELTEDAVGGSAASLYDFDYDSAVDYLQIGSKVYKNVQANFQYAFDFDDKAVTAMQGVYTNDTFVQWDGQEVFTYDESYTLIHRYEVPDYADVSAVVVLDNGKYLVQYAYPVDIFAKKYDFTDGGTMKYDMETKFVNPRKGSVKNIDCKYVLTSTYINQNQLQRNGFRYDMDGFNVIISGVNEKIVDKKLTTFENHFALGVKADGSVKEIKGLIPNQNVADGARKAAGYYYVTDLAGQGYLLDEKGKVQKQINDNLVEEYNDNYLLYNGKLFDKQLQEVKIPDGYKVYGLTDSSVLLQQEVAYEGIAATSTKVFAWDGGNISFKFNSITDGQQTLTRELFGFVDKLENSLGAKYTYYNRAGVEIFNSSSYLTSVATNREKTVQLLQSVEEKQTAEGTEYQTVYYVAV